MSFIVLALPQSATFWLSHFLSYREWHCGHDELQHCRSLDDVWTWYRQPNIGSVETAAAPFWRLLLDRQPDVRIATVRRPLADVLASLARAGLQGDDLTQRMQRLDQKLDQIEHRVPGVLSVSYADIRTEEGCARLFAHCLPHEHDPIWWWVCAAQQRSRDILAQVRYCQAYAPQLEKLARAAKAQTLAIMARDTPPAAGFTFQQEPFDVWLQDAEPLFRQHMIATGQDVDDWSAKNFALFCQLDAMGLLQIITARCNGRMFGYLASIIAPSLDREGVWNAEHLPFFVSPDCPGLGMKLQRAAEDALLARGVSAVMARAGVVGSGPRLGAMYRRLGYEHFGTLYRRELRRAV